MNNTNGASNLVYKIGYVAGKLFSRHGWIRLLGFPILLLRGFRRNRFYTSFRKAYPDITKYGFFLYSKEEQREHFFGEAGTLREFREVFIIKSWEECIRFDKPEDYKTFFKTFEGKLVKKYSLNNESKHTPFFLIFGKDKTPCPLNLNKEYHDKMRGSAAPLITIENGLKVACCKIRDE